MAASTAPLLVAAALLVLAGAPKTRWPGNAVGALKSVGVHVPGVAVRAFGAAEAAIGIAAIVTGARAAAALVAASYVGFSAFLVVALRKGGVVSSCGCVGRADTPPTTSHLAVTTLLAAGAITATVLGADGLTDATLSVRTATLVGFVALSVWLSYLVFTALARLSMKDV